MTPRDWLVMSIFGCIESTARLASFTTRTDTSVHLMKQPTPTDDQNVYMVFHRRKDGGFDLVDTYGADHCSKDFSPWRQHCPEPVGLWICDFCKDDLWKLGVQQVCDEVVTRPVQRIENADGTIEFYDYTNFEIDEKKCAYRCASCRTTVTDSQHTAIEERLR